MTVYCGAGAGVSLDQLPAELERLAALGYTAAELNPEYLDCIFGGRSHARHLDRLAEICRPYALARGAPPAPGKLALTVHSPAVMDLRHAVQPALHAAILRATVEVAAAAGAGVVVVHYEQKSPAAAIETQFRRAVEAAAALAGARDVVLAVENIEVERCERVLEFVDRVAQPQVRMTYDFGHDFLAASHFGYDFLASVRAAAPYAVHAHLSDNFGRFDPARLGDFTLYKAIPARSLNVAGMGDTHLPLGWGALPYDQAVAAFRAGREEPFQGVLLGEHRRAFAYADAEVLQTLRGYAAQVGL